MAAGNPSNARTNEAGYHWRYGRRLSLSRMRPASVADEGAANEHEGGDTGALRRDYLDAPGVLFHQWADNLRYSKAPLFWSL